MAFALFPAAWAQALPFSITRAPGAAPRILGNGAPDVRALLRLDDSAITTAPASILAGTSGVITPTSATSQRIVGVDRYATAATAAEYSFASADTAVIVSGTQPMDAGFAAGLAGVFEAPVLATDPVTLSASTAGALSHLGVSRVVLVGDASVISDNVKAAIEAIAGIASVERIAGATPQVRAANIALRMKSELGVLPNMCIFVNSWDGATVAAPIAYSQHIPILLVFNSGGLFVEFDETRYTLASLALTSGLALFTGPTIYTGSAGQMIYYGLGQTGCYALFVPSSNPVEMSLAFAEEVEERGYFSWQGAGISSASSGEFAVGVGSSVGRLGGVTLLTPSDRLAYGIDAEMYDHASTITEVQIFGSEATLSSDVEAAVSDWSKPAPAAPALTRASSGNRGAMVSCSAATDVMGATYGVWRSSSDSGPFERIATSTQPWYWDSPLTNGSTYWYKMSVNDPARDSEGMPGQAVAAQPAPAQPVRVSGKDRYETAIATSRWNFAQSTTVVIATGENFPDALSASGLCGVFDAPLLLTPKAKLPSGLLAELDRLGVTNIFLIGSTESVSANVENALQRPDRSVRRIGGKNRYETSALIARNLDVGPNATTMFLVRGDSYADALSVSPWSFWYGIPVLLTRPDEMPSETRDHCIKYGINTAIVIGGESAVNTKVLYQLPLTEAYRISGSDRYATSVAVAQALGSPTFDSAVIGVATGTGFADALGGGVACGYWGSPLLLTSPKGLSSDARNLIVSSNKNVQEVQVFGGASVLPQPIVDNVTQLLLAP